MFNFKELLELWRSDNLLTQAYNASFQMLESTSEMYRESVKSLRRSDDGAMGINVYDKDAEVNHYERKVRRKVLKHLAVTGGVNIIPGLILTTIVIDIERIGDYTKNIMDLAGVHPKLLNAGKFDADLQKIEAEVGKLFEAITPALRDTDKNAAARLIKEQWWMLHRCDEIMDALVKEEDASIGAGDAAASALYARYLKRIAAHILNVATSIVNPFDRIGFVDQDET